MDEDETHVYHVCSRGLLKSCDIKSSNPASSIGHLDSGYNFNDLQEGSLIYVCTCAVNHFLGSIFPNIPHSFVLVTGDCDICFPNDVFYSSELFEEIINQPKLIHWFSQNCLVSNHPKLTQMPIGMDYHTMSYGDHPWGPKTSPVNQEKVLYNIKQEALHFSEREVKCYANFQYLMSTRFGYERQNAIHQIPSDLVYYEPHFNTRVNNWKNMVKYAFTISPPGNGLDCHRTWEALCLGSIPILKSCRLDPMFDGLPVLIVNSWEEVTQELLNATIEKYSKMEFQYEKLALNYWVDLIRSKTNA